MSKIWLKKGKLVFYANRLTLCEHCVCDCEPYILARHILEPHTTWDLSEYMEEGYAKPAPYRRKWQLWECSWSTGHGEGTVSHEGTLLNLPDHFDAIYAYNGYMVIRIGCYGEDGRVTYPSCEAWE